METITLENVFTINVPGLALDSRFGSLIFDQASNKLSKAQEWLKEVNDLKYSEILLQNDIEQVNSLMNQLAQHLEWLRNFDIGAVTNAKQEHDNFNIRINGFYDNVYSQVLMRLLPFLREERRRENPDQQQLDEEIKRVVQIRSELETELKNIKEETQKIRTTDKKVGSARGERAAVRMAIHFDSEVGRYENLAKRWFWGVIMGYLVVVGILIWIGIVSAYNVNQIIALGINTSAIWSAVVSKLVILAALWFGLSFIIKNYNVNSHLVAVNRHRAAVARTLEDFIALEQQQEKPRLSEILQNSTDAMFKHTPIGFVSKTEKESGSPVLQIVNDLIGIRNNS